MEVAADWEGRSVPEKRIAPKSGISLDINADPV